MSAIKLYVGGPGTGKTERLVGWLHSLTCANPHNTILLGSNNEACLLAKQRLGALRESVSCTTMSGLLMGLLTHFHKDFGFSSPPRLGQGKDRAQQHAEATKVVNHRMFPTELGYEQEVLNEMERIQIQQGIVCGSDIPRMIQRGRKISELDDFIKNLKNIAIDDCQELANEELNFALGLARSGVTVQMAGDLSSVISQNNCLKRLEALISDQKLLEVAPLTTSYVSKPWVCKIFNQVAAFNKIKNPKQVEATSSSKIVSQNFHVQTGSTAEQEQWIRRQAENCLKINNQINVGIFCRTRLEASQIHTYLDKHGIQSALLGAQGNQNHSRVMVGIPSMFRSRHFSVLIIPSMIDKVWPFEREPVEAARRLLCYAIGRCKSVLFMISPATRHNGEPARASRLIQDCNTPEVVVHRSA